ncbi:MAG TPA: methionyl aminopeptidase [Rhabdochlamydiaceae bacterium]|nr:methionyl aminopeptidase [Rhabdochlamydiaceae bacterium]
MNVTRNDPCWCGSGKKWKKCHFPQMPPEKGDLSRDYLKRYGIVLKNDQEIAGIRKACHLAAHILDQVCKMAKEGVTTLELDQYTRKLHQEAGAIPAPLGYGSPPYPYSICTSLNDVICHGFPDDVPLKEGDIVNIDVSTILHGYFGDCSRMVAIGKIDPEKQNVMDTSHECLMRAIAILKPGVMLYEIGNVIEEYARAHSCSVVNQFVGHGIGLQFHEPPQVPHHHNNLKIALVPGMTFTIEPMINAGLRDAIFDANEWTVRTADGKPSAQWEHTLLITDTGHEILTFL